MAPFSSPVMNIMEVFIFNQFPFDPALRRNLSKLGYTVPTPVQAAAIPLVLAGKDLIVI